MPLTKQILVQEDDYVRAGSPLSDGAITPADILNIKGPTAVQEYIVNEVQDVYRMQGVKINDKHFEVIVRQMMRKVLILEPGDTRFLEQQVVDKRDFHEENDRIFDKKVVVDAGDSQVLQKGQIVTAKKLRDENSTLKRKDLRVVVVRDAVPATSAQILQGITRAALQTSSFMSAASFQETTKVLNEAAINGKSQYMLKIPNDFRDSGFIDGCGHFRIWFKIILPMCVPTLVSLGVLTFMGHWNNYLGPMIYLSSRVKMTVPLVLRSYKGSYSTQWHLLMAASCIALAPVVLLYIVSQKFIISGIMMGGIKG